MCNSTAEWFKAGGRLSAADVANTLVEFAVGMVRRPEAAQKVRSDDAVSWLDVLVDDVSHLRRVLTAEAPPVAVSPSLMSRSSRRRGRAVGAK